MTRPIAAAALAAALAIPALAAEPEGPSFDCAKASSRAEKTICDVPELAWQDRQMGKAYKVALAAVGKSGEADLKAMCEKLLANTVVENYRVELLK